jgi:hypothetical protein
MRLTGQVSILPRQRFYLLAQGLDLTAFGLRPRLLSTPAGNGSQRQAPLHTYPYTPLLRQHAKFPRLVLELLVPLRPARYPARESFEIHDLFVLRLLVIHG